MLPTTVATANRVSRRRKALGSRDEQARRRGTARSTALGEQHDAQHHDAGPPPPLDHEQAEDDQGGHRQEEALDAAGADHRDHERRIYGGDTNAYLPQPVRTSSAGLAANSLRGPRSLRPEHRRRASIVEVPAVGASTIASAVARGRRRGSAGHARTARPQPVWMPLQGLSEHGDDVAEQRAWCDRLGRWAASRRHEDGVVEVVPSAVMRNSSPTRSVR